MKKAFVRYPERFERLPKLVKTNLVGLVAWIVIDGRMENSRWRGRSSICVLSPASLNSHTIRFRPNIVMKGTGVPFAEEAMREIVIAPGFIDEPSSNSELPVITLVSKCTRCLVDVLVCSEPVYCKLILLS